MRAVLEQKANPRDLGELLEGLAASDCSSFLNDNCVFMHLKKGESCWAPYGWYVSAIGIEEPCVSLFSPWCNKGMLKELADDTHGHVLSWNIALVEEAASAETENDESRTTPLQALLWFRAL